MGKVEVVESFPWSPDGSRVITIEAGQVVEGRAAEVAMQLGKGRPVTPAPVVRQAVVEPERRSVVEPAPTSRRRRRR